MATTFRDAIKKSREIFSLSVFNCAVNVTTRYQRTIAYGISDGVGDPPFLASRYETDLLNLELNSFHLPIECQVEILRSIPNLQTKDIETAIPEGYDVDALKEGLLHLYWGNIPINKWFSMGRKTMKSINETTRNVGVIAPEDLDSPLLCSIIDKLCQTYYSRISPAEHLKSGYTAELDDDIIVINDDDYTVTPRYTVCPPVARYHLIKRDDNAELTPESFCFRLGRWKIVRVWGFLLVHRGKFSGLDFSPLRNFENLRAYKDRKKMSRDDRVNISRLLCYLVRSSKVCEMYTISQDCDDFDMLTSWSPKRIREKILEEASRRTGGNPTQLLNLSLITGNPQHSFISLPCFGFDIILGFEAKLFDLPGDLGSIDWDSDGGDIFFVTIYMLLTDALKYYDIVNINKIGLSAELAEGLCQQWNVSNLDDLVAVHQARRRFMPEIKAALENHAADEIIYQPGSRWISSISFETERAKMIKNAPR